MRLIMLGAPGAGKGTQAVILSERFNIPHISTGDIFRSNIKEGTELGKKAKEYIDKGLLVPDEITIGIVKDRLLQPDCRNGFILDGFPRTIPQAQYLDKALEDMGIMLDAVINIYVSDDEIVRRMSGRRVCPSCGMSYHTDYNPPGKNGECSGCGTAVVQREDDREETVIKRLQTYHAQTEPLIDYYEKQGKILTVTGRDKIEDTTGELFSSLDSFRQKMSS
ncbi:adenylate kinase [Clostridium thermosuccinogenes]|uniref:Adenylate kinase n=1 Tax=Clostridium thermosuccinogenes TaxID=84032 RepID=A0A2K2F9E4_9CLOT|nr:adenylate kinase [Pseudoclostridium thermosuccinogenes]AUS98126.1 adenylate kinase [Pseudoclostridium thermosuccinogenes]PNT91219.1 adenylate kinase [Pseudoclostridium thermosuccinogenes]PNT95403.1 adenylate kinase [Pseudoclostridium thermosuccinogenes]PNT96579.1 adenylate kinase [Pseudoclostridium thermosuccinogenes]